MEYRDAYAIELFDANTTVGLDSDHVGLTWEKPDTKYVLRGETLAKLAQVFDIPTGVAETDSIAFSSDKTISGKVLRERIDDIDVEVERLRNYLAVSRLEARIDGPLMVSLRVTLERGLVTEHTVCGAFAIEWKIDKAA